MEIFRVILTDYWAQLSFLLLGIGYIVKVILESINKRKEIIYSFFQQNKLNAVNNYLSAYSEVLSMIRNIPEFEIYRYTISAKEIDAYVQPPLSKLNAATNELHMYLEEKQYLIFKNITNNIEAINSKMIDLRTNINPDYTPTQKSIDFYEIKTNNLNENENLISEVLKEIRKNM
ncbi:MAG: hypothetical protein ACK5LF_16450 [Bacteroides xylanisolvens]